MTPMGNEAVPIPATVSVFDDALQMLGLAATAAVTLSWTGWATGTGWSGSRAPPGPPVTAAATTCTYPSVPSRAPSRDLPRTVKDHDTSR